MDDITEVELVYIKIAPNREEVLKAYKGDKDYLRPIEISKKTGLHINQVSINLKKLRVKGYVYLMNPEYKMPRLYKLTPKGKKILKLL